MSEKKAKQNRKEQKLCCDYWKGRMVNKGLNSIRCNFCPECGRNLNQADGVIPWFSILIDVLPPNGQVELSGFPDKSFYYCMMIFGAAIQRLASHFKAKEEKEQNRILRPGMNIMNLLNKNKKGFG